MISFLFWRPRFIGTVIGWLISRLFSRISCRCNVICINMAAWKQWGQGSSVCHSKVSSIGIQPGINGRIGMWDDDKKVEDLEWNTTLRKRTYCSDCVEETKRQPTAHENKNDNGYCLNGPQFFLVGWQTFFKTTFRLLTTYCTHSVVRWDCSYWLDFPDLKNKIRKKEN